MSVADLRARPPLPSVRHPGSPPWEAAPGVESRSPLRRRLITVALVAVLGAAVAACGDPGTTPTITPGTAAHPRNVIIVAKDYTYVPAIVDLVPGESVVLQVLNGGLVIHEVVIGGMDVQDAWEAAEAATAGAPPGPTPQVSVAPDVAGLRIVVRSGERVDVPWTVPLDAATSAAAGGGWLVGCHIPGHWAAGMKVPVRFVGPDGRPLPTGASAGAASGLAAGAGSWTSRGP
jgi:uncharacterized cupredoxin-like copper-binding protein